MGGLAQDTEDYSCTYVPLFVYMLMTTKFICISQSPLCLDGRYVSLKSPPTPNRSIVSLTLCFAQQELCIPRNLFSVHTSLWYSQKRQRHLCQVYVSDLCSKSHEFHLILDYKCKVTEVLSFCSRENMK